MNFGLWFIGMAIMEAAGIYAKRHKIFEGYSDKVYGFIAIIGIICLVLDMLKICR